MDGPAKKQRIREELRREAEIKLAELLREGGWDSGIYQLSMVELQHELAINRIEREMQEKALLESRAATEAAKEADAEFFDNAPTSWFKLSEDGTILALNFAAARMIGGDRKDWIHSNLKPLMSARDGLRYDEYLRQIFSGDFASPLEIVLAQDGVEPVHAVVEATVSEDGTQVRAHFLDVTETNQAKEDRRQIIAELEVSIERVKLLTGLLPLCVVCKKVRNDNGQWDPIEIYIEQHSDAKVSCGLCPNCFPKFPV